MQCSLRCTLQLKIQYTPGKQEGWQRQRQRQREEGREGEREGIRREGREAGREGGREGSKVRGRFQFSVDKERSHMTPTKNFMNKPCRINNAQLKHKWIVSVKSDSKIQTKYHL